jgi:hypothetical protein
VPQDDDKNERVENKDTHVSYEQAEAHAQDVDAPQPSPQVFDRRNSPLLQAHPQDLIIGSPTKDRHHLDGLVVIGSLVIIWRACG